MSISRDKSIEPDAKHVRIVSGIPKRIYLQWHGDEEDPDPEENIVVSEVTWSLHPVFDADVEYFRNGCGLLDAAKTIVSSCEEDDGTLTFENLRIREVATLRKALCDLGQWPEEAY